MFFSRISANRICALSFLLYILLLLYSLFICLRICLRILCTFLESQSHSVCHSHYAYAALPALASTSKLQEWMKVNVECTQMWHAQTTAAIGLPKKKKYPKVNSAGHQLGRWPKVVGTAWNFSVTQHTTRCARLIRNQWININLVSGQKSLGRTLLVVSTFQLIDKFSFSYHLCLALGQSFWSRSHWAVLLWD